MNKDLFQIVIWEIWVIKITVPFESSLLTGYRDDDIGKYYIWIYSNSFAVTGS